METRLGGGTVMTPGGLSDLQPDAQWHLEIVGTGVLPGRELVNWGLGGQDSRSLRTPVTADSLAATQESKAEAQP